MGNVNEKNAHMEGEKEILNPRGHFDPWTVKAEARAIEAVLFPGIEPRYPPSPEPEPEPRFTHRTPDANEISPTILTEKPGEESLPEKQAGSPAGQKTVCNTKEPEEDTEEEENNNDNSLPLSDSIIPDCFEFMDDLDEEFVAAAPTDPEDVLAEVSISTPITPGIRSLGTIEELDEEACPLNANENTIEEDPVPRLPGHLSLCIDDDHNASNLRTDTAPTALRSTVPAYDEQDLPPISPEPLHSPPSEHGTSDFRYDHSLVPSDTASAIMDQIGARSPLVLTSNIPGVTLQYHLDVPLVPSRPLLSPTAIENVPNVAAVLSPLVLDPPTLRVVDDMMLDVPISSASDGVIETTSSDKDDLTPRVSTIPQAEGWTKEKRFQRASPVDDNTCLTPLAPYLDTIPLPPFPTEENVGLFVSESFANSGLGLIVPMIGTKVERPRGGLSCPEHTPIEVEETLTLAPCPASLEDTPRIEVQLSLTAHEVEVNSHVTQQTHLSVGIQAPSVANAINLIETSMGSLTICDDVPPPTSKDAVLRSRIPVLIQETRDHTPKPKLEKLSPALSEIRTYADATNIAMQHPELAKEILQTPLPSSRSLSTLERFTKKVEERGGLEHTHDRPNWAKASVGGDSTPVLHVNKVSGDALHRSVHTPSTPNWAVAPVLKQALSPKSGRSQREWGCSRTKKGKNQNTKKTETSQPICSPAAQPGLASLVIPKMTKERFERLCKVMPPLEFVSTEEQRKVTANCQKVSEWINDSASVMDSPKTERASLPASSSAFLMDSISERVINEGLDERATLGKDSPASRMARASAAQEARERGSHDEALLEDKVHSDAGALERTPMTSPCEHVKALSPLPNDRRVTIDKGKKPMVRSPSPVGRQRSASTASSLASGISTRSGVSTSSRLFQRAIQEIGSPALPRSAAGNHNDTHQIPAQGLAKEPAKAATQPPELLRRKSPHLDITPIGTTAVTFPEIKVTQEATENTVPISKGKVKTSTPLGQMVQAAKGAGSNSERFTFSFKPPKASISGEDQKVPVGSREVISPYTMKLGSPAVPTVKFEQGATKTRDTSTSTFVPKGKYIPPPIREGQTQRQTQATLVAIAPAPSSTFTSQPAQIPDDIGASPAMNLGLNVNARPFRFSDDAMTKAQCQFRQFAQVQSSMGDVRVDERFGAAGGPLSVGQEGAESLRSMTYGRQPSPNAGPLNARRAGNPARNMNDPFAGYPQNMLVYDRLGQVKMVKVLPEDRAPPPSSAPSQQRLEEYIAYLEHLQQEMADFAYAPSGFGQQENFNPSVTANQSQNLNFREHEARLNSTRSVGRNEPRSFLQSPVVPQNPTPNLVSRSTLFAPRLPNQVIAAHNMFEEYSKRQRQETRMAYEHMTSRLPRRKS